MSLEKFIKQPVSYFRFTHDYVKLGAESGTTIRFSLKDDKNYSKRVGDIVWMIHSNKKFKAVIEKIDKVRIMDIPFEILRADVAPFQIKKHLDFLNIIQSFYDFPLTLDSKMYVIYWRRVE